MIPLTPHPRAGAGARAPDPGLQVAQSGIRGPAGGIKSRTGNSSSPYIIIYPTSPQNSARLCFTGFARRIIRPGGHGNPAPLQFADGRNPARADLIRPGKFSLAGRNCAQLRCAQLRCVQLRAAALRAAACSCAARSCAARNCAQAAQAGRGGRPGRRKDASPHLPLRSREQLGPRGLSVDLRRAIRNMHLVFSMDRRMVSYGVIWCHMVSCGVMWCHVVTYGVIWCRVVSCGVVWCHVVSCGVIQ